MNEIRYEVNWHSKAGEEIFTVTPITVVREGVLPGCSMPTITAIGSDGRRFQGNPGDYFKTEEEAYSSVREELRKSIGMLERHISAAQDMILTYKKQLEELK